LVDDICEPKPNFIYEVIETLLPQAIFSVEKGDTESKMLELWGPDNGERKGWTKFVQQSSSSSSCIS